MSLSVKLMFVLATVFVAIDFDALRQDVEKSRLCRREYTDPRELTSSDNSTLTSLLDKHAPMKEKVVVCRQRLLWFNVILLKLFYYQTFFETWHNQHSLYEH